MTNKMVLKWMKGWDEHMVDCIKDLKCWSSILIFGNGNDKWFKSDIWNKCKKWENGTENIMVENLCMAQYWLKLLIFTTCLQMNDWRIYFLRWVIFSSSNEWTKFQEWKD